jgi:hypothetical protein
MGLGQRIAAPKGQHASSLGQSRAPSPEGEHAAPPQEGACATVSAEREARMFIGTWPRPKQIRRWRGGRLRGAWRGPAGRRRFWGAPSGHVRVRGAAPWGVALPLRGGALPQALGGGRFTAPWPSAGVVGRRAT